MDNIYLDNAGTTPMATSVIEKMTETMTNVFGNASAINFYGRQARKVLDDSRHIIAKSINATADNEIIFTSGGTESDNTAIIQTALARKNEGRHIITTAIEHEAVLKPMAYLEREGFEVTYLPVDENGEISLEDLKRNLREDTILVSVMMGNNEVGSHMPIHEIGQIVANSNAWFHTDCVQTYGILDIDVQADKIDMLSTSAHKLNGPKYMGFLYQRKGLHFESLLKGGDQELKRRAGTENVPAIAGFAQAVLLANRDKADHRKKYMEFKQQLITGLETNKIAFEVNGKVNADELPHVLSIWFKGCRSDVLLTNLDLGGISAAAGSACTAGSLEPSHVLSAMYGTDSPRVGESLRFSFGITNTAAQIDETIALLAKIIKK
ncbi:cysteine desulfurase [Ligilactobacillus sp. WILCCON 0076]|uniref:Cysteine desulfurase n=1 Tax=Ligilactobacillus ubinensis TaxID=2876789 RepID=A0A9X2JKX5_9LACO|nr:cysteine desulfurase family protein [Ligilactobacillus ubinensis]MCP0886483.1 cysteine desulfurase [Ligilactobacillus ubinensis]